MPISVYDQFFPFPKINMHKTSKLCKIKIQIFSKKILIVNSKNFEDVLAEEKKNHSKGNSLSKMNFSLALSGGGVRAAAVARGLIQKLDVQKMDYISSVSGGGYASGELLQENSRVSFNKPDKAPNYSKPLAVGILVSDIFTRLAKTALPIAIILLFFPYFQKISTPSKEASSAVLLTALCLAMIVAFTIERSNSWARITGRAALAMLTMISVVVIFRAFGFASFFVALISLILVRIYIFYMPHRVRVFHQFKHWPKAIMIGFAIALLIYTYPVWQWLLYFLTQFVNPQGGTSIGQYIFLLSGLAIFFTLFSIFFLRRNKTLFNYYSNMLSDTYLVGSKILLDKFVNSKPYPIFNVTANDGEKEFLAELTPLYVGSFDNGYVETKDLNEPLSLADAITASASAFDIVRHGWGLNAALSFMADGTGYWMKCRPSSWLQRLSNSARVVTNMPSSYVLRLADGGFTDNLGLTALLRRKISRIVCLDAAYDPDYNFNDLRKICNDAAMNDVAQISIEGLHNFANDLRFAQGKSRVIKLDVSYGKGVKGIIFLAKLSAPNHLLRKNFRDFPHITTNDQQLKKVELEALYEIGSSLGEEIAKDPLF